jgi:hypothetical protein
VPANPWMYFYGEKRPMQEPQPSSALTDIEVKFFAEPLQSWRMWTVEVKSDTTILRSITYKVRWPFCKPFRSHCLHQWRKDRGFSHSRFGVHNSPDLTHGCGIYSVKNRQLTSRWHVGNINIFAVGEINMWGKIYCFTEGYISEYAYPTRLLVDSKIWDVHPNKLPDITPHEVKESLEGAYQIPVTVE